jgi:hypothetical protein
LCDLIEGWIIAIQQMHIGDKWELYIPAEMGYGKFSQPGIPGGSTLIFEIELLGLHDTSRPATRGLISCLDGTSTRWDAPFITAM